MGNTMLATDRVLTPDLVQQLRFVRHAGLVGDEVFYTVTELDDERRERESLWLVGGEGSEPRRLAATLEDIREPAASPDGSALAVLADVDGRKQVVLVPVDGREERIFTSFPQGIAGPPVWSPDGRTLAVTAGPKVERDPSLPYFVDRVTYRAEGLGNLDDVVTDLYLVDVETGDVRQLTDDRCMNSAPAWSPDGRSLAYLVDHHPDRIWTLLPELHVLDVATGETRVLVDTWGGVFAAAWCDGGRRIAFIGSPATGIIFGHHEGNVWTIDATDGGQPECRTASVPPGVGLPALVSELPIARVLYTPRLHVDDNHAYVNGPVGGQAVVYRVALVGPESVERAVESDGSTFVAGFHARLGVLHYATSFVDPPDLVLGARRLTALNDQLFEAMERPQVRHFEVTAPDGLRTDAWAFTPPGEGPWPTVLYVHGGPWCTFGSVYTIDVELLVAAGIAVVANNFRGSGGYSTEFSQKIIGDWGGFASLDHHATVDEAIRLGIADADRVGVCGLSHGGFATTWLAATSDRFKAAVAENPITDFTTFFDLTDSEWWMRGEFGGTPRDVPEVYRATSPLTYAPNCRTPMLLIVGEADLCCNPLQSEQYYRVLRSNGVPTKMLRLPNSSHGGTHDGPVPARVAQNRAQVDWFKEYLL